MKNKTK